MKFILKISFLIIILVAAISCNNENPIIDKDHTLIGTWELKQYFNKNTGVFTNPPDITAAIEISFLDKSFEGNTERNAFFGNYYILSNELIFKEYISTEVAETEWGSKFMNAIISTYNSENKKFTMLYYIEYNILKIKYQSGLFIYFEKN